MNFDKESELKKHYLILIEQDERERLQSLNNLQKFNPTLYKKLILLLQTEDSSNELFEQMHSAVEKGILESLSSPVKDRSGESIGNYILRSNIGDGGMAHIYMAERNDGVFEQTVAIKIMRQELDRSHWLQQFKDERKLLARLNHDNIARIYDGGVLEEGLPYFIMEYVDGIPIDRYCNQNGLTVAQRLKLFIKVCKAVQIAHQNLIIHCDLKPSNILITPEGKLKLLDFGIGQLLDDMSADARNTSFAGTPEYASPEQRSGAAISTTTDLYQLGIILYKLLVGELPDSKSKRSDLNHLFSFPLKISEEDQDPNNNKKREAPTELNLYQHFVSFSDDEQKQKALERSTSSTKLCRKLNSDLQPILNKAISSQNSEESYSVIAMAEDIQLFLNLQPIKGGESTLLHRSSLFFKRNKWKSAVTAFSVLLLIILTSIYLLNIHKAEQYAQMQARKAEVVSGFMIDLFNYSDPTAVSNGKNLTAYELLEKGMERAEMLEAEPMVQSAMYEAIAESYANLNDRLMAKKAIQKSIAIKEKIFPANHPEFASSYEILGGVYAILGEYSKSEEALNTSFNIASQYESKQMQKMKIKALSSLGYLYREKRELHKADSSLQLAIQNANDLYKPYDMEMAALYFSMGTIQKALFNYEKSKEMHLKVQGIYRRSASENIVLRQENLSGLGIAYIYLEQFEKAEEALVLALDLIKQLDYKDGRLLGMKYDYLSLLYKKKKEFDKAIYYSQLALKSFMEEYDSSHIYIAVMQFNLGQAYAMMEEGDSTKKYYSLSLKGMKEHYNPEDAGYRRVLYIKDQLNELDSIQVSQQAL